MVNRRRLLREAAALGAGSFALAGRSAQPAAAAPAPSTLPPVPYRPTPPHLIEAQYIVDYLRLVPANNSYRDDRDANLVTWGIPGRPETWMVRAQCASFLTAVLQRTGLASPVGPKLRPVTRVADLQPGDLVAIDYRNGQTTNTGHVVLVRQRKAPYTSPARTLNFRGEIQFPVEVVDCTSDPHGLHDKPEYPIFPDTRLPSEPLADGPVDDGVGYGHLMFYASAATGAFTRYRWSVNASSAHTHTVAEQPIAAARVVADG
jgi:hypothetical protein